MNCKLIRDGELIYEGNGSTKNMKRSISEFKDYLFRNNTISDGTVFCTGTAIGIPNDMFINDGDLCHIEVENKLKNFNLIKEAKNQIIFNLINEDYLNETRFCENFVRGKFKIKNWGKIKIKMELKTRKISNININQSLKQIHEKEYLEKLDQIFEKKLTSLDGLSKDKKKKKIFSYLQYRGWETNLIYDKINKI